VAYDLYGWNIFQQSYEPLLWYNGTSGTDIIPWLAQSFAASSDLKTYTFTLRSNIAFQDGEPLNSTSVYFSLNRLLILDGSSPSGHGTQASWILQQLLNTSLSSFLCACSQSYGPAYVNSVLSQNFVQVTGRLAFTLHVGSPKAAFSQLFADPPAAMIAPIFTMQHDLALWSQASNGYKLPYSTLTGNLTNQIRQYFLDEVATCNSGVTPAGCGTTYFDGSYSGSQAGTGPYVLQSFDKSSNNMVFKANPSFWGGPYQFSHRAKIVPHIPTINVNFVPDLTTRELDLRNAAKSGQAMTIDITPDRLYDLADRSAWLKNNQLVSTVPGVTIYGPYTSYSVLFDPFATNVTNSFTGKPFQFQPFADLRLRLAFADGVNLTQINNGINNKLGQVALNVMPPGFPPEGAYDKSIVPKYSFNPLAVQNLLLDAMKHPLTKFTFTNGTIAPRGIFNNTFGCSKLNTHNSCDHPVPQSVSLTFPTGDTVDQYIFNQIASTINNVSATYNMGLTAGVVPVPVGQEVASAFSGQLSFYSLSWTDDYPWTIDFLGPLLTPGGALPGPNGWNLGAMKNLFNQAVAADSKGDLATLVKVSNAMTKLANDQVMYMWTFDPLLVQPMTSNVRGYFFNPSLYTGGNMIASPVYFASLY
jgi:ABC-type transport system substrate-binding protein